MVNNKAKTKYESRVLDFIKKEGLVIRGQTLVVGVSGGADSIGLLLLLLELQDKLGVRLQVAHLDHRLRGAASAADAKYVARLARRLGLPATIDSRDVRAFAREYRLSIEEAAREVRYAFLAEVARESGAERVAVGHTRDDHVETILMHILRGSGLGGLGGLRPLSRLVCAGHEITVIRPLLVLSREETAAYCRQRRLRPRSDASNLSPEPLRNRVRLRLLPELREYNPRIDEALARLARLAADDLDFIEAESERRWDEVARDEGDRVVLDRLKLAALPPALGRRLLRMAVQSWRGSLKDIEAGHIEDLLEALEKPSGKIIGLPGGLKLAVEHNRLVLGGDTDSCPFPRLEGQVELNVPGRARLRGWEVLAEIVPQLEHEKSHQADGLTAWLDFDRAGNKLVVRARQPGDHFQPLGLRGTKELTEFMIDARIPRAWRPCIPIVASPTQIVWVVGWRIDERVRTAEATRRVLRLTLIRA